MHQLRGTHFSVIHFGCLTFHHIRIFPLWFTEFSRTFQYLLKAHRKIFQLKCGKSTFSEQIPELPVENEFYVLPYFYPTSNRGRLITLQFLAFSWINAMCASHYIAKSLSSFRPLAAPRYFWQYHCLLGTLRFSTLFTFSITLRLRSKQRTSHISCLLAGAAAAMAKRLCARWNKMRINLHGEGFYDRAGRRPRLSSNKIFINEKIQIS